MLILKQNLLCKAPSPVSSALFGTSEHSGFEDFHIMPTRQRDDLKAAEGVMVCVALGAVLWAGILGLMWAVCLL
jgi:hypothetical protein